MMMKSVFWWRKPEYPEETTGLRQVTDEGAPAQLEGARPNCKKKIRPRQISKVTSFSSAGLT